jgi:uncharacterized membrane protein
MQFAYIGTLSWQLIWLAVLPMPTGPSNIWLAIFACLPFLFPLYGIIRGQHRSMIYGGIVLLMYFTIAVTQMWTNPAHHWPALLQILLVITYLIAFRQRIKSS